MKTIFCFWFGLLLAVDAFADPQLTSWLTLNSGAYARIYSSTANRTSGTSSTTWGNQAVPAYADIAQVSYSANWVYVRASDLPSYVSGPWLTPQGTTGQFSPTNQHLINRFPRSPSVQTGTKTISGTGYSGLYVDGIAIFNFTDGKAWDPTNLVIVSGSHNKNTYYWHRNAPIGESYNFDYGLGHQNPSGVYHTHQQPIALRYQSGDHVDYNSSTKDYAESSSTNLSHSPIIGWAYDGYPIYGPYGYSISNDASSGIRRMVSGYVIRDGKNGTDNLTNNLNTIPAWYARFRLAHFGGTYSTTTTQTRPSVSGTNYLSTFAEDYAYYGDLTNSATGQLYAMGTNTFDLDEYNGRWSVTPEYPSGTYAYFLDISTNGSSVYPFAIAYEYYGTASGGSVSSITETVTTNFNGAADSALTISTPSVNTNYVVTLTWSSTEGGSYQIESSTNDTTWTVQKSGVSAAAGTSTSASYTNSSTSGTAYARVTRTALATYDPTGGGSGVVGQTNVISFQVANAAPVVANPIPNLTNTYGTSLSYTFSSNTFTDADAGETLTYAASSSALTNTGISFNSATRTFSATTIDATNGGTIAGSYVVSVVATDNGSPAMSATNTFTLVINKAAASVSANSFTRVYGNTNPVLTGTVSGFLAADSITANYSTTATTNSGAAVYPITASWNDPGSRLGNYVIATNNGTLTITSAVLTVTGPSVSRGYGATNPVFSAAYSGFVNGQSLATSDVSGSPSLTTSAATNSAVGSYPITNSLGTLASGNYSFNLMNGTLAVTQAVLSVTASNMARSYGATNPVFSAAYSGFVNGQTLGSSGVSGSPALATSATTNSPAGSYVITNTLGTLSAANYSFAFSNGTLTVTKAALTVAANSASRVYGGANPIFTVTYTGFANGETAASGTISGAPSLTTSAVTNSAAGAYVITNSLGTLASADYSFSSFANGTLTITQAILTVTATNVSRTYGATNPVFSVSYSGFTNGETLASSGVTGTPSLATAAVTNSPVGAYIITNSLGSLSAGNYSLSLVNGTLTVAKASLLAVADNSTSTYGSVIPTFTGTITGAANGDVFTESFACPATSNSSAGNYTITVSVNDPGSKLGNYNLSTTNGTLVIGPATLLVAANNASRAYGATNPTFTATYTGLVNGDSASSALTGAPSLTSAGTNVAIGTYAITNTAGTLAASNYVFAFTNGTLQVTQAVATVTPADASRAYGQTNPILTGTLSGIVNGDNVTANYSTTATTSSTVGTYPIVATLNDPDARLANYIVITNQGTFTVTNGSSANSYTATFLSSNSVVALAALGTTNLTFTDTNSGLAIAVTLTMAPYSLSNANPTFTFLDTYGFNHSAVHVGIDSKATGGDGNWVDGFESVHFTASLASASSSINTNTIQFGIVELGIRPNGGNGSWISSSTTNAFAIPSENLYALDTNLFSLSSAPYAGKLQGAAGGSAYQLSDYVNSPEQGLVFEASFHVGSIQGAAATLGTPAVTGNQLQLSVAGTSGASYVIEVSTNLASPNWIPLQTNTAPFTFTESNLNSYVQRFYRAVTAQ